jgi:transposase InsO family protein
MKVIIARKARQRQAFVKCALKKGKTYAAYKYGVPLSTVKRWCKRYDGTLQSLDDLSRRPHSHPKRHTKAEEKLIKAAFKSKFFRYGWDGTYDEAVRNGYERSYYGLRYAAKRMGLTLKENRKPPRKQFRKFPELSVPGEKVQIDVKFVPYCCLKGKAKLYEQRFYQYTAIDECTRFRFVYAFDEHTPENSVKFLHMLLAAFPFKIQTIQTDNGTEFTYKYISDEKPCPFEEELELIGIKHKLIPPRTPWHNGKVERSHRTDQRYFYNWEKFGSLDELNRKLAEHLEFTNNKTMRVLGFKSPAQRLREFCPKI